MLGNASDPWKPYVHSPLITMIHNNNCFVYTKNGLLYVGMYILVVEELPLCYISIISYKQ